MAASASLVLAVLAIVLGDPFRSVALAPLAILGAVAALDLVLSVSRKKALTHDLAAEVFVGESAPLELSISKAPQKLQGRLEWPEGISGPADVAFSDIGDGMARASVACEGIRRGTWALETLWLQWASRLGLFEFIPRLKLGVEIRVVPNIRLVQSGSITSTVQSALFGVKENRAIGEGSEFHQLREFERGMDVKTIDWKRSARMRGLVARELRAERNHHVIVALDNGYLMGERIAGLPKIDHAVTASLAVAWAAAIGGDLVGFFSYDARPRIFSAPEPGRRAFAKLRSQTAELEYVNRETNHTLALSELNARTPKRSLIIIFTDFIDTTSAELLIENVSILAKRHLVVFVAIRDPESEAIAENAPEDMEGVATLVSASQSLAERRMVFERLDRLGVTVLDTRPGEVTAKIISTYLEIKARDMI